MKDEGLVLHMDKVTVRYPGSNHSATCDCSLEVAQNEKVALLGANGSGKTSLLMAIVGLVPFSGSIRVNTIDVVRKHLSTIRDSIGFLFSTPEDQILFPKVVNDVAFGLVRNGVSSSEAYEQARDMLDQLEASGLAELSPYQLSHGQRLRVALAGALICKPALLLLDEPSTSLDTRGKKQLVRVLASLPSAVLIATHDIEFAQRVCTRFVILEEGRVHMVGTRWDSIPGQFRW
jgi:cobalt/nickel transport system ATP-binding protein